MKLTDLGRAKKLVVDRFGEALREGRIRPMIARTLPLADAMEAHRVLQASEHFGKVVLVT